MKLLTTVVLVATLVVAVSSMGVHYDSVLPRIMTPGCDSHTCGINARCTMDKLEGRPVCSCFNLHMGDPLVRCEKVECVVNDDCPLHQHCSSHNCINPCANACGIGANCEVINHVATCSCPPDHTGDPFHRCVYDPDAPCKARPCGVNTMCNVVKGVAVCTCLPGYVGSGIRGCRHECESNSDCGAHLHCSANFRCESPCKSTCGDKAHCEVINHVARCTCPPNWLGNPLVSCRPECESDSQCSGQSKCLGQKCIDPCANACGVNANCEVQGIRAICSCPRHMTGNPFMSCRPFTPEDLCNPNPCGVNAKCTPGHDNLGQERPVCTCLPGYIGNALYQCQRGECTSDIECPHNRACIDYSCQNPCTGYQCHSTAICTPERHIAVCTCPLGTDGDALTGCYAKERYGGRYRFSRDISNSTTVENDSKSNKSEKN